MNSGSNNNKRITYQPFLLAICFLALTGKIIISMSSGNNVLDWLFWVILLLFLVAIGVYIWERSKSKPNKQNVTISTGKVKKSELTGVLTDSSQNDVQVVQVKTKDVSDSKITGIKKTSKK